MRCATAYGRYGSSAPSSSTSTRRGTDSIDPTPMRSRAGGATQGTNPSDATWDASARAAPRLPAGAVSTSMIGRPVDELNDFSISRRRWRVCAGTSAARPWTPSHSEKSGPVTRPEISPAIGTARAAARSGAVSTQIGATGQRAWIAWTSLVSSAPPVAAAGSMTKPV